MTVVETMMWFIGMAIATVTILTVGILSAADIIRWQRPRRWRRRPSPGGPDVAESIVTAPDRSEPLASTRSRPPYDGSHGSSAA
jgi:hypothetical protein